MAGKVVPHNTCWAGNPAIQIKKDILGDKELVFEFDEEKSEICKNYQNYLNKYREDCHADYWIFKYDKEQEIPWEYLDEQLSCGTAEDKCYYLIKLNDNKGKNRFVHNTDVGGNN